MRGTITCAASIFSVLLVVGCNAGERVSPSSNSGVLPTASHNFTVRTLPGNVAASPSRNVPVVLTSEELRHNRLAIAIAEPHALGGAVMKLVRDPSAQFGVLLIVDRHEINDHTLIIGRHFLIADQRLVPNPTKQRVITVYRNQRLKLEVGDSTFWSQGRVRLYGESPSAKADQMTTQLLSRESGGQMINVPLIGRVHIVYDPASPLVGAPGD
jgi:hypothetical protein